MAFLKQALRNVYYSLNNGRVTKLKVYKHLQSSKWVIDNRFGMAYFKGYYEPEICAYLLQNINKDSVFVDVGGHAGYFSLFAAKLALEGKVFSFEPEPNNFKYITASTKSNDVKSSMMVYGIK